MPVDTLSEVFLYGAVAILVGVPVGFAVMEPRVLSRIAVIVRSFRRRRRKRRQRACRETRCRVDIRSREATPSGGEQQPIAVDPVGLRACRTLADRLAGRHADSIDGVFLFGSRARGDFCPESDVDVAVVLSPGILPFAGIYMTLVLEAFSILIRQGTYLQPRLLVADSWQASSYYPVIEREGVRVWPVNDRTFSNAGRVRTCTGSSRES